MLTITKKLPLTILAVIISLSMFGEGKNTAKLQPTKNKQENSNPNFPRKPSSSFIVVNYNDIESTLTFELIEGMECLTYTIENSVTGSSESGIVTSSLPVAYVTLNSGESYSITCTTQDNINYSGIIDIY